ncbi:MAG TPA: heavy-metal-associated domain-containing protein [Luteimonas sp.]
MRFHIDDMTCGGCVRGVTRAIQSVDPTARVEADPPGRTVDVASSATREQLEAALTEAGFPPRPE